MPLMGMLSDAVLLPCRGNRSTLPLVELHAALLQQGGVDRCAPAWIQEPGLVRQGGVHCAVRVVQTALAWGYWAIHLLSHGILSSVIWRKDLSADAPAFRTEPVSRVSLGCILGLGRSPEATAGVSG